MKKEGFMLVCNTVCSPYYSLSWVSGDDGDVQPDLLTKEEAEIELEDIIQTRREQMEEEGEDIDEEDLSMGFYVQRVALDGDSVYLVDEGGETMVQFNWKDAR